MTSNNESVKRYPENTIFGFGEESEYYFLSNFYPCEVKISGFTFTSAECAYQAMLLKECKIDDSLIRPFETFTPLSARESVRTLLFEHEVVIPDTVKVKVMRNVLSCKFSQNPELKEKLYATEGKHLVAFNDRDEVFFGMVYNPAASTISGQNYLGILLEELRDKIRTYA